MSSAVTTIEHEFVSVLQAVGKDFQETLAVLAKDLPAATVLAGFIFPPAVAPMTAAESTATLLQNAIVTVEQKYAASGAQSGTGVQKAAEVLTLTQAAVTTMLSDSTVRSGLAKADITVNATYIGNLINAVVGFLNVQGLAGTAWATV